MTDNRHDSISNHLSGLGIEEVDSGVSSLPTMSTRLWEYHLEALYLNNDIASTIVDELPESALRGGFTVKTPDEPDSLLVDSLYRLNVYTKFLDVAKTARLYGAAYLWLVVDDGTDITQPLEFEKVKSITQLIELDAFEVTVERYQKDRTIEGYGEAELYRINTGEVVHHTRMLGFIGERLPKRLARASGSVGESVLQRAWPAIRRFTDVENSLARITHSFQHSVFGISGLASIMASDEGAAMIEKRLSMIARSLSVINGVVIDKDGGESFDRESSSVAGLPEIWDRFALSVARASKMPMSKLFKQAPSGLNTDGFAGIDDWNKSVQAFREHELTPQLDILLSLIFTIQGNEPEEWLVSWPPLEEATEAEIAATRKLVAETDAIYLDRGVRSPDQVAQSRDGGAEFSAETRAPDEDETYQNMLAMMEGGDGQLPEGD